VWFLLTDFLKLPKLSSRYAAASAFALLWNFFRAEKFTGDVVACPSEVFQSVETFWRQISGNRPHRVK